MNDQVDMRSAGKDVVKTDAEGSYLLKSLQITVDWRVIKDFGTAGCITKSMACLRFLVCDSIMLSALYAIARASHGIKLLKLGL